VQLLDTKEQLRSFVKADLREHGFAETPMPSFRGRLSAQEIADVVSYLVSLRN
jgi:mono/diheme cytochrome c family protein